MCDLVVLVDKYGVQWLLILALLFYIWHAKKTDDHESRTERELWHSDIRSNTSAIIAQTLEMKTMCKNYKTKVDEN